MDARLGPLALAALLVLAGCAGAPSGDGTKPATTVDSTATSTDEPTSESAADDTPPKGTQFVSLDRYENQSRHAQWPDNRTTTFANLSESRQRVFEQALSGGSVEFGPDESNPFSYRDDARPRAVRYEGVWYYVRVSIV